jgi:hypothetical protein
MGAHNSNTTERSNLILARDGDGRERWLFVTDHPSGMVSIVDGRMVRTMEPRAAAALVLALVHAMAATMPSSTPRPAYSPVAILPGFSRGLPAPHGRALGRNEVGARTLKAPCIPQGRAS